MLRVEESYSDCLVSLVPDKTTIEAMVDFDGDWNDSIGRENDDGGRGDSPLQ